MKRLLIALIIGLMACGAVYAADAKITELAADTTPTSDDLITTVDDVAGTATNKKVTLADLAANFPELTTSGVNVTGGAGTLTIAGSGEGVITMDDSDSVAHNLTIGTAAGLFIDGTAVGGGDWSNTADNSTTGSLDIGQNLTVGDVAYFGGLPVFNFTDVTSEAEFQLDGTLAMDLTVDSASGFLSTAALHIGTDLTTDGTNLYWKGEQLNA